MAPKLERNVVAQNTLAGSTGIPAKVEICFSVLGAFLNANGMIHQFCETGGQLRETRYLQPAFLQFFFEIHEGILCNYAALRDNAVYGLWPLYA